MTGQKLEAVKRRILKLLERTEARGCTPSEAQTAAAFVASMLTRYGLTMRDAIGDTSPRAQQTATPSPPRPSAKPAPPPPPEPDFNENAKAWETGFSSRDGVNPFPADSVKAAWFDAAYAQPKASEYIYSTEPLRARPAPSPVTFPPRAAAAFRRFRESLRAGANLGHRQAQTERSPDPAEPPRPIPPAVPPDPENVKLVVGKVVVPLVVAAFMLFSLAQCNSDNQPTGGAVAWMAFCIVGGFCFFLFWLVIGISEAIEGKPVASKSPPADAAFAANMKLLTGRGVPLGSIVVNGQLSPLTYAHDAHLITVAMTGSGKNLTVQSAALIQHVGASAVVVDPKGQLTAITAPERARNGHVVRAINAFDVLGIPTATHNPLNYVSVNSHSFVSDVRRIIEGVVDRSPGPNDHFSVSALDFATMYAMWVVWCKGDTVWPGGPDNRPSPPDMSLIRVRELIAMPAAARMKLCDSLAACPYRPIAEAAPRYGSDSKDSKEVRDSTQTANTQFAILRDPGIERVLRTGPNEISFANLKKRRETVYLIIPPDLLETHGKFLRLLTLSALGELFKERTRPAEPILFMLDEFTQLGKMPLISESAAIIREYRVQLWLIIPSYPKLVLRYGRDDAEAFLSSAGVLQAFGVNDMTTARMLSERSGTRTVRRPSGGSSWSTSGSSSNSGWQETEEPNWKPGDIIGLNSNEQLLFVPGLSQAIHAWRFRYNDSATRPDLVGKYDPDPYHGNAAEFERKARAGEWVIK